LARSGQTVNPRRSAQTFSATVIIKADVSDSTYVRIAGVSFCKSCLATITNEIRIAVCQTFWAESKGAEKQFLIASLAKARKLREVFVRERGTNTELAHTPGGAVAR
jgi:hypothetical protein